LLMGIIRRAADAHDTPGAHRRSLIR
jgi:hypothetical protein